MKQKNLIEPFVYLDENQCPKCFSRLKLLERETMISDLNKFGYPRNATATSEVEVALICPTCKSAYPAKKKGMYYHIRNEDDTDDIIQEFNPFYI